MDKALNFVGTLPSSKSLYNRALIAQSFFPQLRLKGSSQASDVEKMKIAISQIGHESKYDCGEGGTVLRFLALRLSREIGEFELYGHPRLFARPQDELVRVLSQLGVKAQFKDQKMYIESMGWKPQGDTLLVPCGRSSQFLSAVALSSWKLPFDLYISPENFQFSRPYFYMTQRLLERMGMRFRYWSDDFCILKDQSLSTEEVIIEPDLSSCFSLAAVAVVSGSMSLKDFPEKSLQPDIYFVEILKMMGAPVRVEGGILKVSKAPSLNGIRVQLKGSPDLFPVLSALCALAKGPSELRGAPHLKFKESSRVEKMAELLTKLGCQVIEHDDGLSIIPPDKLKEGFEFDPEDDHRLAFAAGVLLKAGVVFKLLNKQVVDKSFPEFWSLIQGEKRVLH